MYGEEMGILTEGRFLVTYVIRVIRYLYTKGPFKCYVMQMGVGGLIFWKKALRRCNVQCY